MFKDLKAKLIKGLTSGGEVKDTKMSLAAETPASIGLPKSSAIESEVTSRDNIFLTLMAGVYDPNRLEFMTQIGWTL